MTLKLIITIVASLGFMIAIMSFIAGFRMVKGTGHFAEARMHRINGYITIVAYLTVAVLSIASGTRFLFILGWVLGFLIHMLKLLLVKKKLAARYGGYVGAMLIITWLIIIFTHLPK